MKPQLIDNLAYQIRTLSNAIIGFSNLLSAEDLNDTQREYVNEILQAGKGLSGIVNDVLDLVRIESGNLRPDSTECDLAGLLENIQSAIGRAAAQKGLEFEIIPAVQKNSFDAILMDIQLPDLSGYEVTRQLRQMGLATPIIALSAGVLDDADDRQICELFNAFLAKPVDGPQLAQALQSFLPTTRKQSPKARSAARES